MTPRLTILATSSLVAVTRLAAAAHLASYPDSMRQAPVGDLALCIDPSWSDPGLETRYTPIIPRWWAPFSMNLAPMSLLWPDEEQRLHEWLDFAPAAEPSDGSKKTNFSSLSFTLDGYSLFNMPAFVAIGSSAVSSIANEDLSASLNDAGEVHPELTSLTGDAAAQALRKAWRRAKGELPSLPLLVILTAHWAHETAAGASMFNYNFGGIKGRGPEGLNCLRRSREGFGIRTRVKRGRFRAYPNAASGADDYVSLLLRKYAMAIEAAEGGDAAAFVSELRRGGYFTGSEETYVRSLCQRTIRAREWARSALAGIPSVVKSSPDALLDPTDDSPIGTPRPLDYGCGDASRPEQRVSSNGSEVSPSQSERATP